MWFIILSLILRLTEHVEPLKKAKRLLAGQRPRVQLQLLIRQPFKRHPKGQPNSTPFSITVPTVNLSRPCIYLQDMVLLLRQGHPARRHCYFLHQEHEQPSQVIQRGTSACLPQRGRTQLDQDTHTYTAKWNREGGGRVLVDF